jgi:polyphosphate kinase
MKLPEKWINREISWLNFNERVLQEAEDESNPLIERMRFLGIFSNNRDEFFRVRVATIRRLTDFTKREKLLLNEDPDEVFKEVQKLVLKQQARFDKAHQIIVGELAKNNIHFVNEKQLTGKQEKFVRNYFNDKVRTALVPILIRPNKPFPFLKDNANYLIVKIYNKKVVSKNNKVELALIEIPSDELGRILQIPSPSDEKYLILLDDIIRLCLPEVFSFFNLDTIEAYSLKLTRDAELDIDEDISKSLVDKLSKSIKNREVGEPVRFVYDANLPKDIYEFVIRKLKLEKSDSLIPGGRYHNFKDFIDFPEIGAKMLRNERLKPLVCPDLHNQPSILEVLRKKDVLLFYPYQKFDHLIDFLRESAIDPKVKSIKINLYRVAKKSKIINALVNAVENGKEVTVLVELRARFDEQNNIRWANYLQEEGVKVTFGLPGLKVHSKLIVVSRLEGSVERKYAHVGTGNFNEKTANLYSDISLLTCDPKITNEVEKVFDFIDRPYFNRRFSTLVLSPFNTRSKFINYLNEEIKNAKKGLPAYAIIKLNNINDPELVRKLYEASCAGVKIKMIIRGVCSLVPGVKNLSENIEVISVIDRFLEHVRLFVFCNNNDPLYYIGSADWLTRNLDKRVEVTTPIFDKRLQKQIQQFVDIQLSDNVKARYLDEDGLNKYKKPKNSEPIIRSQLKIYEYFSDLLQESNPKK